VPSDSRPALAIIANVDTPYRQALHLRIAREIVEFRLSSVFTHDVGSSPWALPVPVEIGAHFFGPREEATDAPRRPLHEFAKGGRIISFLGSQNTTVVVLNGYNDLGRLRILRHCRRVGIPCFLWSDSNARSDRATGIKRMIKKIYLRYFISRATGVLACGSLGREYFLKYGADGERIFYFPYEPDYAAINSLSESFIREIAERFRLADRRRIVYSGRLVAEKNVELLIGAFVAVAAGRPEWDLVILGDGPLKARLEGLVPSSLTERVIFIGFQADQNVVSAVYRNCDVLCLPSTYEPWALVINEAAAAGLAIVSSDIVGAAAELVRDGENGSIFSSGNLPALTDALLRSTDRVAIDRLRAASPRVLDEWRRRGDPVAGLERAIAALATTPDESACGDGAVSSSRGKD
jgi:glycosyltransferase involved in cell wall biosynthesis